MFQARKKFRSQEEKVDGIMGLQKTDMLIAVVDVRFICILSWHLKYQHFHATKLDTKL